MPTTKPVVNVAALVRVAQRRLDCTTFAELVGLGHDVARTPWVREQLWKNQGLTDQGRVMVLASDGRTPWPARSILVEREGKKPVELLVYVGQDGEWGGIERTPPKRAG